MGIFTRLQVHNWRQFANVEVNFHPRLTVLTGANGTGKTTILHLLNRHWGWNIAYVSTPHISKMGVRRHWAGFWSEDTAESPPPADNPRHEIGEIEYADHDRAVLTVPRDVKETFAVNIDPQPVLSGVYVASHRPMYLHQRVDQIPTAVDARQQIFDAYLNEMRQRWSVKQRVTSPNYVLKRSLISLAVFGYGSETVTP